MLQHSQNTELRFLITVLSFASAISATLWYLITFEFSVVWILMCLVCVLLLISVLRQFRGQKQQIRWVLKALANGDSTLGLSRDHPLQPVLDEIKQGFQAARLSAEQQAYFLKTLLLHIDLAVLVFDGNGKVIESNPAVSRLLGKSIKKADDLKPIEIPITTDTKQFKTTIIWHCGERQDTLSMHVNQMQLQGDYRTIVTLQSIHDALKNKEQQAYKQLTKVLTHEVANSITPLSSLAQSCQQLIPQTTEFESQQDKDDLVLALTTINKRTLHLGDFISRFREVNNLPTPVLSAYPIDELLQGVYQLHRKECESSNIQLDLKVDNSLLIMLDHGQIEQVLINLLKNAMESVTERQTRETSKYQGQLNIITSVNQLGQYVIDICDNGMGIDSAIRDMMFVPFFTTKTQGSGIGLSLSRQIMLNHGGDLLQCTVSQGAKFRCIFG